METERVSNALAIVCGSRAHLEDEAIATRSLFRTILMHGFHTLVWILAVRSVRDTQCGFKLLTREAARVCFSSLHVERWYVLVLFVQPRTLNSELACGYLRKVGNRLFYILPK